MLGNAEAEEFCLVPAESTFTAIQPKIVHVEPNEKALKQLHMLSETAAVRAQIVPVWRPKFSGKLRNFKARPPGWGAAEARRAEAVVAKRLAQRFVSGAWQGRMY
jgi:hypothetical protein